MSFPPGPYIIPGAWAVLNMAPQQEHSTEAGYLPEDTDPNTVYGTPYPFYLGDTSIAQETEGVDISAPAGALFAESGPSTGH